MEIEEQKEYWNNLDGQIEFNRLRILQGVLKPSPKKHQKHNEAYWLKKSKKLRGKSSEDKLHEEYLEWLMTTDELPPVSNFEFEWWAVKKA